MPPIEYLLTPTGSDKPEVWVYTDSLDERGVGPARTHDVTRHAPQLGGTPSSDFEGLEPGEVRFSGQWHGSEAATLADRLNDGLAGDVDVTTVELQAVDADGWTDVDHPLNGTYKLADECGAREIAQADERVAYSYQIQLVED